MRFDGSPQQWLADGERTSAFLLFGFGTNIVRKKGSPAMEHVVLTEPIHATRPFAVHADQLGGARHLSAAQFVHDQHDVASQDGRLTAFQWSDSEQMVHAHRVETLLL